MKIKSLLVVAVLATAILCSGGLVKADNSALIAQLQAQIASLMAQLQTLQAQQGTTATWCHTFNNNLGFTNSGTADVSALHTALQKENISYGLDDNATYSEDTATAVVKFQTKYGITQSGYIGAKTRAELNALYGCGTTICPMYVTSVCGSNGTTYSGNSCLGYKDASGNLMPSTVTIASQGACTSSTVPSITSAGSRANPTNQFYSGDIVTLEGSGFPSDATIQMDHAGTAEHVIAEGVGNSSGFNITFTVPTMSSGVYSLYLISSPSGGFKISNGIQVTVLSATQPSITVISPNGGEQWAQGSTYNITWTASNFGKLGVQLSLVNSGGSVVKTFNLDPVAYNASWPWTIDASVVPGNYKVLASSFDKGPSAQDYSDNYFTIVAPTASVNGTCGSANGVTVASAPTANLCSIGNASSVSDNNGFGAWTWGCNGSNGGTNVSCSAPKVVISTSCTDTDVNATYPDGLNYYQKGTTTDVTQSLTDSCSTTSSNLLFEYNCQYNHVYLNDFTCPNGCSNGVCINSSSTPINGACGTANGVTVSSAPTANLCLSATTSAVSGSGPWTWTCSGTNGGTTASCSAPVSQTVATCATFTYSAWSDCSATGQQTRTVSTSSPTNCTGGTPVLSQSCTAPTYTITYNGNGNTGGAVPVDSHKYTNGSTATFLGNTGNLTKTGYTFSGWGWNSGDNSSYPPNDPTVWLTGTPYNVVVYARWIPAVCTSFTYSAWSTCSADGTQTRTVSTSSPTNCTGGTPVVSQSCTASFTVIYDGNGNTGGSVPVDSTKYIYGGIVTLKGNTGNLTKTGYTFAGWDWNSGDNSSDPTISNFEMTSNTLVTTLYAEWTPAVCTSFTYSAWSKCSADGTQTRTVSTSSPTACTGGTPVVSQSCNGVCGSANGVATVAAPTANLCSAGTATGVYKWTSWIWNCLGSGGGTTDSCSAPDSVVSVNSGTSQSGLASIISAIANIAATMLNNK